MTEITPASSTLMLTSGAWGTLLGATASGAVGLDADAQWATTLAAGNVAVLTAGGLAAFGLEPSWQDVGLINGMTALGTAGGGLVGVIFLYDEDDWSPMLGAAAVGTTVGAATGVVLAASSAELPGASVSLPSLRSRTRRYEPRLSVQPVGGPDGGGAMLRLDVDELMR
jgi:hypothetical protein